MKHQPQRLCKRYLAFCATLLVTAGLIVGLVPAFLTTATAGEPAPAARAGAQKSQTIKFHWHHYDKKTGYYNPADEGKEVSFPYFITFTGTNPQGKKVRAYVQKQYKGKIGEATDLVVPTDKIVAQDNMTYTDCDINGVILPIHKGNKIYGVALAKDPKKQELDVLFSQNMQTQTTAAVKKGDAILKEDEGKIAIRYTLERIKDGKSEYPYKSINNRRVIESTLPFAEGPVDLWAGKPRKGSFKRALEQNNMEMFNPYTGRYIAYKLHAEFAGNNKDELAKRYTLTVSGNDLDGWRVELGRKVTPADPDPSTPTTPTAPTAPAKPAAKKVSPAKKHALPKTGDPAALASSLFGVASLGTTLLAAACALKKH